MPEILGLDKQKWKWVGLAALGVGGLYLLTHRGASSAAGEPDTALPITGPPQLGNQTPTTGNYFDQNEAVAHQLSRDEGFLLKRMQQDQAGLVQSYQQQGPPVISKAWQQVQGGWLGIKADNQGRFLSEEAATNLASQNHGPYAQGKGGFFGQLFGSLGQTLGAGLGNAAGAWTQYGVGQIPRPPQPKPVAYTPTYTYGNTEQAPPYPSRF